MCIMSIKLKEKYAFYKFSLSSDKTCRLKAHKANKAVICLGNEDNKLYTLKTTSLAINFVQLLKKMCKLFQSLKLYT